MHIIFLVFYILFLILKKVKNYFSYEYFIVNSKCKNNDIFKAINQVSGDINDLRYSTQKNLKNREKYNDMYRWYLNQKGVNNRVPSCNDTAKLDQKKENAIIGNSVNSMFSKAKKSKPVTKDAAKNRAIIGDALNKNMANSSDEKIRQEWVDMVSGKMINNANKEYGYKCPVSTKSWGYNILEKCVNGKNNFNTNLESERVEKEELEKILNDDISVKNCKKIERKCHSAIMRYREKAVQDSYKYSIDKLRMSVKNNKEKGMNKDVKNLSIPKNFL